MSHIEDLIPNQGLETFGVGRWREISAQLLPSWDEGQVRVRAAKLLGSQSLKRYEGWSGDRQAVQAEFMKNRAIGEATSCWCVRACLVKCDLDGCFLRIIPVKQTWRFQEAWTTGRERSRKCQAVLPPGARRLGIFIPVVGVRYN